MRKTLVISLCVLFALTSLTALASAKNVPGKSMADRNVEESPDVLGDIAILPPDLLSARPSLHAAAADTFHLAWFGFGQGVPNWQGWTTHDETAQITEFFHVASGLNELQGGTFGGLVPLEGLQSVWCGV